MPEIGNIGRVLIILGVVLIVMGALLSLSGKVPWLGRLPGDIIIRRKGFTFYFPLATGIVLSIILSLILWLIGRK